MAKKGYSSSYKEKVYYDNTVFRGIMATTDPNAEGYFKQLINFNIDDTGQSLIPRKGLLHTCFHLEDGHAITFDPETTVYYKDQKTGCYIFIDMNSFYGTHDAFISMYHRMLDNNLVLTERTLETFLNTVYSSYLGAVEDFNHGGEADVYTNWYNTHYYNTDVNFYDAVNYMESIKQVYGTNLSEVYDSLVAILDAPIHICRVPMELSQKFFTAYPVEAVEALKTNSDDNTIYLYDKFPTVSNIEIIGSHYAQYIVDDNLLGKNIIKVKINNTNYTWLEFIYNETDNTMLVSVTDIYSTYAIDMSNRNLASDADIIPNPIYTIYDTEAHAHADNIWFNKFPIIYMRKGEDYLINYTDSLAGLEIVPSYFLLPPESGYKWAYTYDILSTDPKATADSDNLIYRSPGIYDIITQHTIEYPFYVNMYSTSVLLTYGAIQGGESYSFSANTPSIEDVETLYDKTDKLLLDVPEEQANTMYIITIVPNLPYTTPTNITYEMLTNGNNSSVLDGDVLKVLFNVLFNNNTDISLHAWFGLIGCSSTYNDFITSTMVTSEIFKTIYSYSDLSLKLKTIPYLKNSKYYVHKCDSINKKFDTLRDISYLYHDNIVRTPEIYNVIKDTNLFNSYTTALNSPVLITRDAPLNVDELLQYVKENIPDLTNIIFKPMFTGAHINITSDTRTHLIQSTLYNTAITRTLIHSSFIAMNQIFPDLFQPYEVQAGNTVNSDKDYYIYTNICIPTYNYYMSDYDILHYLFCECTLTDDSSGTTKTRAFYYPRIYWHYPYNTDNDTTTIIAPYLHEIQYNTGCPIHVTSDITYDITQTQNYNDLYKRGFFKQGLSIVFYLVQVPSSVNYSNIRDGSTPPSDYDRYKLVNSTNLIQSRTILFRDGADNDKTNQIERTLTDEPADIRTSNNYCIFNSTEGYRLVVWKDNIVYMSEALNYGYFKQDNKKTYPETVLKVLPYKDKLLVFTTQNMYAIFPYEYTIQVENGTDDEGNKKYVQQNIITYNTLPVLYNLYTDKKYLKVIQIYNSMVLYYSTQGQLYLIAPTATVDSDTMYTLKYMNQAANDILLNYDIYINNRLSVYKLEPITKDDVYIDADVSISYIKIFYSVPSRNYTYILFYDIVNNRYFVYDTNVFGVVENIIYTDTGSIVISHDWNNHISLCTYYNEPNVTDNNYDMYTMDNYSFESQDINTEIDTGIIFLNNHLTKRFRSLSTTYKNLNASNLQYTLNLFVDNARLIHTVMGNNVEITNINDIIDNQKIITSAELLESNTVLFDFSEANSNKIVSHTTSIPSLGKNIELQLRFKSKGKYKLQGFGLVYKEHSV